MTGNLDEPWEGDAFEAARKRLLSACRVPIKSKDNGGTGGHNAIYGGVLEHPQRGKVIGYYEYPCHFNTRNLLGCQVMFSRFVRPAWNGTETYTKEWFKWITSPSSPWYTAITLGMSEGRYQSRPAWWYRYGFLFDRLDKVPGNLLQSFLVASRMPKEWPKETKRWLKYVEAGVPPAMAAFFNPMFNERSAGYTDQNGPQEGLWSHGNWYDYPIDHGTCDEDYLKNLATSTLVNLSAPFKDLAKKQPYHDGLMMQYWPVNCVFGNNKIAGKAECNYIFSDSYAFQLRDRYAKKVGKAVEKPNTSFDGTKGRPWVEWRLSFDEQVDVIKQEQRRLSLD